MVSVHLMRIVAGGRIAEANEVGGGSRVEFPDEVPTLTDGTVTLRAHAPDDVQGSYEQCQDPLSQQWTTVPVPYSLDDAHAFVCGAVPEGWREDRQWAFAVEADDDSGRRGYAAPSRCGMRAVDAPRSPTARTPGCEVAGSWSAP